MRSFKAAVMMALVLMLAFGTAYNPNLQAYAASVQAGDQTTEKGLIVGIVKENNPSLGYITLYFRDGSGSDPNAFSRLVSQRNFTYGYEIPMTRDGLSVGSESIQPGDQVFIRLDEEGTIQRLSAKSFYRPVYGTVHLKNNRWLILKKENGTYSTYPLNPSIPVYKNDRPCGLSDILAGDRVRILVQTDGENMDIASVEIEKLTTPVTGVYRGRIEFFDLMRDALAISGLQEYVNGRWENSASVGVRSYAFSSDYKARPAKRASGAVYFALKKSKDGTDRIAVAAYRNADNYETSIRDRLLSLSEGGRLELQDTSDLIGFDPSTIVVKDGRLVDMSAINPLDPVKLSAQKSTYGNEYFANVLVCETPERNGPAIYRGRIKSLDPQKSITLESFAALDGINWTFTNTPKTFDIDLNSSRLAESDGVGNMRDMDQSFIGRSVYIVADGSRIRLVSTAPYAESPVSGRTASLGGAAYDSQGAVITEPTELSLVDAMTYDNLNHQWNSSTNIHVNIPKHAIVVKKGVTGTLALIKPGDEVTILRHAQSQEGILVLCQ